MKKFTGVLMSLLAVGILAGCGESSLPPDSSEPIVSSEVPSSRDIEADQAKVDSVLTMAIANMDGNLPIFAEDGPFSWKAEDAHFINIALSWFMGGETVDIAWTMNAVDAFTFEPIDANNQKAVPGYPQFGQPARGVSLTATATLGDASATSTFVFYLYPPAELFLRSDLSSIRQEKVAKDRVWVEGFVYAIIDNDWNLAFIADGAFGIGLYKLNENNIGKNAKDTINGGFRPIAIGDYVKAIGEYSPYNGLAEVGFIESLEILAVPDYATLPSVNVLVETDFLSATALLAKDASKVRVEGLKFTGVYKDKDGNVVAALDTAGAAHRDALFTLGETEVRLNVNYHIGGAKQQALADFIATLAPGDTVNFEGPLGWFNTPNLAYTDISQLTRVAAV